MARVTFDDWWLRPENQQDFWRISERGVAVSLGETPRYIFRQILQHLKGYHDQNVGYGNLLEGVRIDENNQVVLEVPNPDIPLAEPFAAIKKDFLDFDELVNWVEVLIYQVSFVERAYSSTKFHELCRLLDIDNHYTTVDGLRRFGFYMRNNPLFWDEAAKFLFFRKVLTIKEFDDVGFRTNVWLSDIQGWSRDVRNAHLRAMRDHDQNRNQNIYARPEGSIVFYRNCLGEMRVQILQNFRNQRYDDAQILRALEDDLPKVIPVWFNALVYLDLDHVTCIRMCGSGWMEFLSKQPSVFT